MAVQLFRPPDVDRRVNPFRFPEAETFAPPVAEPQLAPEGAEPPAPVPPKPQGVGSYIGDIIGGIQRNLGTAAGGVGELASGAAHAVTGGRVGEQADLVESGGKALGGALGAVATPYTFASGEVIDQFLRSNPLVSGRFNQALIGAGLDPNDRVSSPEIRFQIGQQVVDEHMSALWDSYLSGTQDEANAAVVAMTGLGLIKFAQFGGPQLTSAGLRLARNAPQFAQRVGLRRPVPRVTPAELASRTQIPGEVGVPKPISDTVLADRLAARAAARPNDLKAANDAIRQRQLAERNDLGLGQGVQDVAAAQVRQGRANRVGGEIGRFVGEEGGSAEIGAVTGVNLARAIVNKLRGQGKKVTPEQEAELSRVAQKMERGEPLTDLEQKVASGIRQEAAHGQFGVPFEKRRTGLSTSTFAGVDAKALTKVIQDATPYRSIQEFGKAVRSGEAEKAGAPQGLIDHFLKGEVEMGLRSRGVSEEQIARMLGREAAPAVGAAPKTVPKAEPKVEPEFTGRLFDRLSAEGGVAGGGRVRTPTPRAPSAEPPTAQGRMPGDVGRVGQPMLKTELEAVKGSAAKQAVLTPGIGKGGAATTALAAPKFPGTGAVPKPVPSVGPLIARKHGAILPERPATEGPLTARARIAAEERARPSVTDVVSGPAKARQTKLGQGPLGQRIKAEAELRAQGQQSLLGEAGEFKPAPPSEGPVGAKAPAEPKTSFWNFLREDTGRQEALTLRDYLHLPLDLLSGSRTIKTAFDLSAPRQAAPLIPVHPKITAGAAKLMIRSILRGGQKVADDFEAEIRSGPLAAIMRKAKLEFTSTTGKIAGKEEAFPTTGVVEHVPGIRESARAYTVFLNKMRYDVFKSFHDSLVKSGRYRNDAMGLENELRNYARFINHATGRGTLITEGQAAKLLKIAGRGDVSPAAAKAVQDAVGVVGNFLLFAPRFLVSRVQYPIDFLRAWKEGAPAARNESAKALVGFAAEGFITLKLAEFAGQKIGDQHESLKGQIGVEWDPRSPNFAKLRVGRTYYDFWAGHQQIVRYAAQFAVGERKVIGTGKIAPVSRAETAQRFVRSKAAPVPGVAADILSGTSPTGEKVTPERELIELVEPLAGDALHEAWEAYREPGEWGLIGLLLGIPNFIGVGVTTIAEKKAGPIRSLPRPAATDGGVRAPRPTSEPGLFRVPELAPSRTAPPIRSR